MAQFIFLLIAITSISQVKAILNCTGASPGPCNNGLCTIVQASGLVCTSGGCCDNTEVISIETGATTFNCANDESSGPLIPGVPCPSDSVKAFDSTGELLCCPLANLIPITPTTVKTYTAKSACTDQINPSTGTSDCPSLKDLCSNPTYSTLMSTQCCSTCSSIGK
ncbi:unnamed protein product, partial [Mesorhabditis belari]|uniref:Uncharacterized protein n=1 Tax=Mesorhabditis belari TaxID=2138241 RepID=A0AAF3ER82_9BILA